MNETPTAQKNPNESPKPGLAPSNRSLLFLTLILLLALSLLCFGVTLNQRAPWFGHATISMAGWMSAGTSLLATQWYREGPLNLGFAMYWEPLSIETAKLEAREPYISFPPGSIFPIYLLAKARGQEPTPALCMAVSLALQCLVAYLLSLITLLALRQMGLRLLSAFLFALIPMALYLWLPSPYYQHQMAFFSDQAVMLPFALIILLELCRGMTQRLSAKNLCSVLMGLITFCAILTDWLFFFVVACLFVLRLYRGELGKSLGAVLMRSFLFWLPTLLALILFAGQLYYLEAFDSIFGRFLLRSGAMAQAPKDLSKVDEMDIFRPLFTFSTNNFFWRRHFPAAFGPLGASLLGLCGLLSVSVFLLEGFSRWWKRQAHPVWSAATTVSFLSLTPCLLYYHVFKSHCAFWMHTFTALKFAIPLALIAFVLAPALLSALFQGRSLQTGRIRRFLQFELAALMLIASIFFLISLREERAKNFGLRSLDYVPIAQFIREHTDYNDVVFSPDYSITDRPPQLITYSMKKVYQVDSLEEIHKTLSPLQDEYVVNLFVLKSKTLKKQPALKRLLNSAYVRFEKDEMILAKISKQDFLQAYDAMAESQRGTPKQRYEKR